MIWEMSIEIMICIISFAFFEFITALSSVMYSKTADFCLVLWPLIFVIDVTKSTWNEKIIKFVTPVPLSNSGRDCEE